MRTRMIAFLMTFIIIIMEIPMHTLAANVEGKGAEYPFTFEKTDYGVQSEDVTAYKMEIMDQNAEVLESEFWGKGFTFVKKDIGSGKAEFYLTGVKGCAAKFIGDSSYIPSVGEVVTPETQSWLDEYGLSADGHGENTSFPYSIYSIKNPETGKYDLFNASTGEYYDYQLDEQAARLGESIRIKKDGLYGLVDDKGELLYKAIYNDIDVYSSYDENQISYYDSGVYIAVNDDSEMAVLTASGSTSGNTFYEETTGQSGGLIGVKAQGKWSVLSLETGEYIHDTEGKYDELSEPENGYFVGTVYIYDDAHSPLEYKSAVISKDESWDINGRLGGQYVEGGREGIRDGKISVSIKGFEWNRNASDYNILYAGYVSVSGESSEDFNYTITEGDWTSTAYNHTYGYYCGFLLKDDILGNEGEDEYYLVDQEGKKVLEHLYPKIQVFDKCLLAEREDGYVLFDSETRNVILNKFDYFSKNEAPVLLDGTGIIVWEKGTEIPKKYGVINLRTRKFSGYLYQFDSPDETPTLDTAGYSNGTHAIWCMKDGETYHTINENFEKYNVDIEDGGIIYFDKELNLIFTSPIENESRIKKMSIMNYAGQIVTAFHVNTDTHKYTEEYLPKAFTAYSKDTGKYGLIKGNGEKILNEEYEYIGKTWEGFTFVQKERKKAGIAGVDGNYIVEGSYNYSFMKTYKTDSAKACINGGLVLKADDYNTDSYYFYDFSDLFVKKEETDPLYITDTYPKNGSSDAGVASGRDIRITFNRDVNIFNDVPADQLGKITIKDYDTDKAVMEYPVQTGSPMETVRYKNSKDKRTIILENAFQYLEEGKKYYVLMNGHCVTDSGKKAEWFKGISDKDAFTFTMRTGTQMESDITYLAACALREYDITSQKGKKVIDFVNSKDFTNSEIWKNSPATYRSFFQKLLGSYRIVESVKPVYGSVGFFVLADQESKKAIVVFDIGAALEADNNTFFKDSYGKYEEVIRNYTDYSITLTGEGASGAVAAYITGIENTPSVTFNAPTAAGLYMAFRYNTNVILNYQGIDRLPCINYSNHLISGINNYGFHNVLIANNQNGARTKLNGLFRYDDNYALSRVVMETKPDTGLQRSLWNAEECKEVLKTFLGVIGKNSAGAGKLAATWLSTGDEVYLGTSKGAAMYPGPNLRRQIQYSGGTGSGETDELHGNAAKPNIFQFSGGTAQIYGGNNQDIYYICGSGTVRIEDFSSVGYKAELMNEFFDKFEEFDMSDLDKYKKLPKILNELADGGDKIFVNTGEISQGQVIQEVIDGKLYNVIHVNDCTIQVKQRIEPVQVIGVNNTKAVLPAAGVRAMAVSIPEESEFSLRGAILYGQNISFDLYKDGTVVESVNMSDGNAAGEYYYSYLLDSGEGIAVCVSPEADCLYITGGNLEKIGTEALRSDKNEYIFEVQGNADNIAIDYLQNQVVYRDSQTEIEAAAETAPMAEKNVTGIEIAPPEKIDYIIGEELDLTGMELCFCYSDGTNEAIQEYTVSGYDSTKLGTQDVQISSGDYSNFFTVTVHPEGEIITDIQTASSMEMKMGDVLPLEITVFPETADDSQLQFISSDTSVAVCRGNYIQAVNEGAAVVTIRDAYGRVEKTCEVTVVPETVRKGDINGDGRITMTDLLMCLHHVSGRTTLTGEAFLAADINGDGAVKMTDLLRILHYVSGRNSSI